MARHCGSGARQAGRAGHGSRRRPESTRCRSRLALHCRPASRVDRSRLDHRFGESGAALWQCIAGDMALAVRAVGRHRQRAVWHERSRATHSAAVCARSASPFHAIRVVRRFRTGGRASSPAGDVSRSVRSAAWRAGRTTWRGAGRSQPARAFRAAEYCRQHPCRCNRD